MATPLAPAPSTATVTRVEVDVHKKVEKQRIFLPHGSLLNYRVTVGDQLASCLEEHGQVVRKVFETAVVAIGVFSLLSLFFAYVGIGAVTVAFVPVSVLGHHLMAYAAALPLSVLAGRILFGPKHTEEHLKEAILERKHYFLKTLLHEPQVAQQLQGKMAQDVVMETIFMQNDPVAMAQLLRYTPTLTNHALAEAVRHGASLQMIEAIVREGGRLEESVPGSVYGRVDLTAFGFAEANLPAKMAGRQEMLDYFRTVYPNAPLVPTA